MSLFRSIGIIGLVLLSSIASNAQQRWRHVEIVGSDFNYELKRNDPDGRYPQLLLTLSPISAVLSRNLSIGGCASLAYRYRNRFEVYGEYDHAYIDFSKGAATIKRVNTGRTVDNATSLASHIQGRVEVSVLRRERERTVELVQVSGSRRLAFMIDVAETKVVRRLNVRGGYGYRNGVTMPISATSQGFSGVNVADTTGLVRNFTGQDGGDYMSMVGTHYVSVGIAFESHKDVLLQLEALNPAEAHRRYGLRAKKPFHLRHKSRTMKVYLDLLINANSRIANMTVYEDENLVGVHTGNQVYRTFQLDPYTPSMPVGFRVGCQVHNFGRRAFGVTYGCELGIPPGKAQLNSVYLQVKAGLHIAILRKKAA